MALTRRSPCKVLKCGIRLLVLCWGKRQNTGCVGQAARGSAPGPPSAAGPGLPGPHWLEGLPVNTCQFGSVACPLYGGLWALDWPSLGFVLYFLIPLLGPSSILIDVNRGLIKMPSPIFKILCFEST